MYSTTTTTTTSRVCGAVALVVVLTTLLCPSVLSYTSETPSCPSTPVDIGGDACETVNNCTSNEQCSGGTGSNLCCETTCDNINICVEIHTSDKRNSYADNVWRRPHTIYEKLQFVQKARSERAATREQVRRMKREAYLDEF